MISNVQEFHQNLVEIKKQTYLALDLEFVPTSIIGQVHQLSLLQAAGYDPFYPEKKPVWVIDLLSPKHRSSLSDPNIPQLEESEYKQLINLVLEHIIGNVTSTKLGIGLVNDISNLKIACDYPSDKQIVKLQIFT